MSVITLEISNLNREQKKLLVHEMTEITARVSGLPPETITMFIKENELDNIGFAGRLLSEPAKKEGAGNEPS